jgi:hypothetical protein
MWSPFATGVLAFIRTNQAAATGVLKKRDIPMASGKDWREPLASFESMTKGT